MPPSDILNSLTTLRYGHANQLSPVNRRIRHGSMTMLRMPGSRPPRIRNQIAHIIFKDDARIAALYSRTLKADIDEILRFLHCLAKSIWYLAYNAERPNLNGDHYGYADEVQRITHETKEMLRGLP